MCFQLPDTVIDCGRGLTNWQLRTVSFQRPVENMPFGARAKSHIGFPARLNWPTLHLALKCVLFVITTWSKPASKLVSDFLSDHTPSCSDDKVASSSSASVPRSRLHRHFLHITNTTRTQEKMRAAYKDALLSSSYLSSCVQLLLPPFALISTPLKFSAHGVVVCAGSESRVYLCSCFHVARRYLLSQNMHLHSRCEKRAFISPTITNTCPVALPGLLNGQTNIHQGEVRRWYHLQP